MTAAQPIAPPVTPPPPTLAQIGLRPAERGLLIGTTGSGKSTLAERLIDTWSANYPRCRTLILDSKPRFKAQWQLNGLPAAPLYRRWEHGAYRPGSVVIPIHAAGVSYDWALGQLRLAWSLGYREVIAQISRRSHISALDTMLQAAYEHRDKRRKMFVYADELNNFFRGQRAGDGITLAITSGRELGIGFLGAAQRPKWISVEALTEMTVLYWFETGFAEDNKHLRDMGIPAGARPPAREHAFYYYNRQTKRSGDFILRVEDTNRGPKKGR